MAEAAEEANVFVSILAGKQFEFPVFFDIEEQAAFETGKANCSAIVRAFCDVLEKNGYRVELYTSRSAPETYIEDDIKSRYALRIAEWGSRLNYSGFVGIRQYSEKGYVNGIIGNVDLDTAYVDYTKDVKENGLNGFGETAQVQIEPYFTSAPDIQTNRSTVQNKPQEQRTIDVSVTIGSDTYKGTLVKE